MPQHNPHRPRLSNPLRRRRLYAAFQNQTRKEGLLYLICPPDLLPICWQGFMTLPVVASSTHLLQLASSHRLALRHTAIRSHFFCIATASHGLVFRSICDRSDPLVGYSLWRCGTAVYLRLLGTAEAPQPAYTSLCQSPQLHKAPPPSMLPAYYSTIVLLWRVSKTLGGSRPPCPPWIL